MDPDGAPRFAGLLNLAGSHEAAPFQWQFAAGVRNSTAAYRLHLARGSDATQPPRTGRAADLDAGSFPLLARWLSNRQPARRRRRDNASPRAAVARLKTDEDEEPGSRPAPSGNSPTT